MTHSFRLAALCCCLLVAVDGATANANANANANADTGTDPSLVIEQYRQHVVVNPNGSFLLTVDTVKRIAGQRALQEHGRYHIRYNNTLDEVVSVEAYTEKPDGRRIKVLPEDIKEQQESVAGEAPVLPDTRLKIVVFPEVALGDRLALHYVVKRHAALFPGHFEDLSSSQFYQNRAFDLIYDMPASMPLYSDARGFVPVALASAAGRKVYAWHYVSGANARIEADSVSYLDYGKRLAVSTFTDYPELARAYAAHAHAHDTRSVTPAIAALALELTRTLPTPRAKALALADWMRRNIGHTGVGGVVPHPAATVLTRRHGGSLDHANLLGNLLAALGIDSSSALINNGNAYRLPRVPTLGVFNHVITFVPSLALYLDSTAATIAAGYLPTADLGKPVLLTGSGKLAATPASQKDQSSSVSWFGVRQTGDSSFKVSRVSAGAVAEPLRQTVRDTAPAERAHFVQRMLQGLGQHGTGEFDTGRFDDSGDTYAMGLSGTSWHFVDLAEPKPAKVATDFSAWGGLKASVARFTRERTRSQDFICPAIDVQDVTRLAFAPALRIGALPKALTLNEANVAYAASYARQGNTVLIGRRLRFHHDTMVCTPAEFRRMQPLFERMQRDLDSVLIVQAR